MTYDHSGLEVIQIKEVLDSDYQLSERKSSKPWTQEEIAQLTQLYISGLQYRDISKKMDRTIGSIEKKVWTLQIPNKRKRYTDSEIINLVRLYSNGKTPRQISKLTGRSYNSIRSELRLMGLCK